MFKKGKFYEMYDRDADIGAQVLNLNYTGGGRVDMRCVGVPEQAFAKHCSYLAEAGYKVRSTATPPLNHGLTVQRDELTTIHFLRRPGRKGGAS